MAKQAAIEQDGVIVEALSNAMFRVNRTRWCNRGGIVECHVPRRVGKRA